MIIEIRGENTASFIMFGDIAKQLLKMMGQSGQAEGAIREPDVPKALEKLLAALEKVPAETHNDEDESSQPVSLHTRAKPLVDLLQESVQKGGYVMWQPQ